MDEMTLVDYVNICEQLHIILGESTDSDDSTLPEAFEKHLEDQKIEIDRLLQDLDRVDEELNQAKLQALEANELTDKCRALVKQLRQEVHIKNEACHQKNLYLDALGHVWCSGGCEDGTGRYSGMPMEEAHVEYLERNAKRARQWWDAHQCKLHRGELERCNTCESRQTCVRIKIGTE